MAVWKKDAFLMGWLLSLLLAPFAGSFLGVLIRRLPRGRPVAWSRSACETCGAPLPPYALMPLLSFAVLRGRCAACHVPIGWFHPAIELAAVAVAAWAVLAGAETLWADCAFGWTLLTLAWIDWEHLRLPDALTLPLILAGLAATLWAEPDAVADHAFATMAAYFLFRGVSLAYRGLRGCEGLGSGDAKLFAAIGAWVGIEGVPSVLILAAGAGVLLALCDARHRPLTGGAMVPFGPPLALAAWVVRLHGPLL